MNVATLASKWVAVSNGRDRFYIQLRVPTYDDRLTHHARATQYALSDVHDRVQIDRERIDWCLGFVTGWRDVQDESGLPCDFSQEHFQQLIVAHPRVMLSIVSAVEDMLAADLTEDQRGNSAGQLSNG